MNYFDYLRNTIAAWDGRPQGAAFNAGTGGGAFNPGVGGAPLAPSATGFRAGTPDDLRAPPPQNALIMGAGAPGSVGGMGPLDRLE